MLKKYIYASLLATLSLFASSCSKEDLGNYDYHDINEIKFTSELNGKITAFSLTKLTISPKLEFTQDEGADSDRYSYEWVYVGASGSETPGANTLAKTRDLDIFVNIPAGTYESLYNVTDNVTGIKFTKRFTLEVRNQYNEGWLLMTDVNGKARLDMLSKQVDGQFVTVTDLLAKANSALQLKGSPRLIYCYQIGSTLGYGIPLQYGLYLGTDQSIDRVHGEFFSWQPKWNVSYEFLDAQFPADFHIDAIKRVNGNAVNMAYMITSTGEVYCNSPTQQVKYSQPANYDPITRTPYKVAPFIGGNETVVNGTNAVYFYDITNRRFLWHLSAFDANLREMTNPDPNGTLPKLFSYTNTGKDMVYMAIAKGIEAYAVLKDPGTNPKYHVARFKITNTEQLDYKEIVATDFDKAENFAISPLFGFLYYNVGGKVYQYNCYTTPATCKLVLDKGAEKITALKFHEYHNTTKFPATERDKLLVGSYNPALPEGENGKLEKYYIENDGRITLLTPSYSGLGKIKSLHYRER